MIEKAKKVNGVMIFKIIYLLHLFLAFNCFTFKYKILDVTSIIVLAFSAIILCYRLVHYKAYISCKFLWTLALFCVSYAVSTFINYQYGIWGNIKGGIWLILQIFVLYCISIQEDIYETKREIKVISLVLIVYTALCSLAGLVMLFQQYGGRFNFEDGSGSFYGFIWGRLWGCYTDPNHGGIITAAAILMALYLICEVKKVWGRILLIFSVLLNYLYIVFSDSRSAKLSLTIALLVMLVLLLMGKKEKLGKKRMVFGGITSVLVIILFYFSFGGVKEGYNYYITKSVQEKLLDETDNESSVKENEGDDSSAAEETIQEDADSQSSNNSASESAETTEPSAAADSSQEVEESQSDNSSTAEAEKEIESLRVGREQDIENDVSNRRFDIWKSGLEIFNKNKILGVGFRNIVAYANENLPETYIVNNDQGEFDSFHNVVIDVLVSQGLLGIISILIIGISFFIYLVKSVIIDQLYKIREIRILFTVVILLLVESMFISEIFYVNSPETILFWMFLGYLTHLIRKSKEHEEKEYV